MRTRLALAAIIGLIGTTTDAADGERQLQVVTSRATPVIESITLYQTKDQKRQAVGEVSKLDKAFTLPNDGPFEVFAKPKGGIAIKVADKLSVKSGQTHDLKLAELIGAVEVLGDNFPRADRIVITDERDPGPEEKGHVPIQVATEYRIEMAVPPGFYSVWIVPANGARAQRVVDQVRALAGKSVRVGD
jgi:hypothetical protein